MNVRVNTLIEWHVLRRPWIHDSGEELEANT